MISCRDTVVARGFALEAHPSPAGDALPFALSLVGEAGLMAMLRASTPGRLGEGRPIAAHDWKPEDRCHVIR